MSKGFSIVECLIALVLLAIIVAGGMAFYFYSSSGLVAAEHRRIATEIANARLEELKNGGYDELPNPAALPSSGLWSEQTKDVPIGALAVAGKQEVYVFDIDESGDGGTDYKQVRVRISWNEPKKTALQEIILDTYIAPR